MDWVLTAGGKKEGEGGQEDVKRKGMEDRRRLRGRGERTGEAKRKGREDRRR